MERVCEVLVVAFAGVCLGSVESATAGGQAPAAVHGRVTAVDGPYVTVDIGSMHGVGYGMNVEIATDEGSEVVRVVAAFGEEARLARPFGVEVRVGAAVRATGAGITTRNTAPPRSAYFGMELRLFGLAGLSDLGGGGVLVESRLRYRAPFPLAVQARVAPMAFGFVDGLAVGAGHGELGLSYDSEFFEFGATVGATATEVSDDFGDASHSLGMSTGVFFRVGARDGLSVEVGMTYAATANGIEWAYARFDATIPVRFGMWLVLSASGGRTRHGMGAIGLRWMLRGSGGPGSLFLTPYFGGGGIRAVSDDFFGLPEGPAGVLLGLGFEARF